MIRNVLTASLLFASTLAWAGCALDDIKQSDNIGEEVGKELGRDTEKEPPVLRYDDLPEAPEYATQFVLQGNSWNHTNITYFFLSGTGDITGTAERQAVRDAFAMWAEVTPLVFTEIGSANADIVIRWATGSHGDNSDFDGTGEVLAHAFYPPPFHGALAGDIHFDDAELWTLNIRTNDDQPIDLVTVAAHEIGHALGLAHSPVSGAIMERFYTGSQRFLHEDDIAGVQALYGDTTPQIGPIFNEYVGCRFGSARYIISWELASGEPVLEYDLDRSYDGSSWSARYNGTSNTVFETSLGSNSLIHYRVRGRNADGWGPFKQLTFRTANCSGGGGPSPF